MTSLTSAERAVLSQRTGVVLPASEADLQAAVIALAKVLGWRTWHDAATNAPRVCGGCGRRQRGPRNAAGLPDLLLVHPQHGILWAELKREDGRLRKEQCAWLDALCTAGAVVTVWRPSDWWSGEIERVLRGERTQA